MKLAFLYTVGILPSPFLNAQDPLSFSATGYDPANCRIAGYQNGNGVVYAAVVGGVPPYEFLWANLTTGITYTNSAWGGLNVGDYKLRSRIPKEILFVIPFMSIQLTPLQVCLLSVM